MRQTSRRGYRLSPTQVRCLVTMNVQRQVAGLFVAEEQGARELKGVSEPVQLFRIVRASGGGRRGGARTLTPFVGARGGARTCSRAAGSAQREAKANSC